MLNLRVPRVEQWYAGTEITADMYNNIREVQEFLLAPPECHVYQSAPQAIPADTWEPISFDMCRKDTAAGLGFNMWTAGDPTKVYIPLTGHYAIEGSVVWDTGDAANTFRRTAFRNPGYGYYMGVSDLANTNTTQENPSSYEQWLEAGTYIQLIGLHNKTGYYRNTWLLDVNVWGRRSNMKITWVSL